MSGLEVCCRKALAEWKISNNTGITRRTVLVILVAQSKKYFAPRRKAAECFLWAFASLRENLIAMHTRRKRSLGNLGVFCAFCGSLCGFHLEYISFRPVHSPEFSDEFRRARTNAPPLSHHQQS